MPRSIRYCRPKTSPEETLAQYLQIKFPYLKPDQWQAHLDAGHLSVNDTPMMNAHYVLKQGDMVMFSPPKSMEPPVDEEHIDILYEDNDVAVCAKNGNLPVTEGGRYCENTLIVVLDRNGTERYYNSDTVDKKKTPNQDEDPLSNKRPREEGAGDAPHGTDVSSSSSPSPPLHATRKQRQPQKVRHAYKYFPVHRLDKETSGVVVLAKSAEVARDIASQLENQSQQTTQAVEEAMNSVVAPSVFKQIAEDHKTVTKSYVAVLAGVVPTGKDTFVITTRIGAICEHPALSLAPEHQKLKKLKMHCQGCLLTSSSDEEPFGKLACSMLHVLERSESLGLSLVRVDILTGRTHQIRLHCAHMGYPVLGDKLYSTSSPGIEGHAYAVDDDTYLSRVKQNDVFHHDTLLPQWQCRRHLLHAWRMSFIHPKHKERMVVSAVPSKWFLMSVQADHAVDAFNTFLTTGVQKMESQAV